MISLATKGVLQYQMYKYIPSSFTINGLDVDVLNGKIENTINGTIEVVENGAIAGSLQSVSIEQNLSGDIK